MKYFFNRVPVDSRNWVYCNALRQGTTQDFDFLWERFLNHNVYNEKILLLQTLGCTPHEASLNKYDTSLNGLCTRGNWLLSCWKKQKLLHLLHLSKAWTLLLLQNLWGQKTVANFNIFPSTLFRVVWFIDISVLANKTCVTKMLSFSVGIVSVCFTVFFITWIVTRFI